MADAPKTGGGYYVDLTGQTVPVPAAEEAAAVEQGYLPASPEQVRTLKLGEKYGSGGQAAISGVEGAADALTLGLSSQLETKAFGVPKEDIRGREEANPGAHALGTGLGILAPIIFSGGAAAAPELAGEGAARAAELTAPSLVTKAGEAAAGGLKAVLPEATTAGGRVATKLAGGLAQGAVEGGLYGLGNVIHEDALGDPGLTASSAMEEVGLSALLGGGLGGASGILGGLAKEIPASKLGEKLADWLPEFEGQQNLKAAGARGAEFRSFGKRMGQEELNKIGREAGDLGLVGRFSTPTKSAERAAAMMEDSGGRMGDILAEADASGAKPIGPERLMKRALDDIVKPLEANPLEKATAAKMREILDGYRELHAEEGISFKDLHAIRKQLSDKIYGLKGMLDPDANALKSALHDFRSLVSEEIDKGLEKAGLDTQAWKTANREYRVAATISDVAEKALGREAAGHGAGLADLIVGHAGYMTHGLPGAALFGVGAHMAKQATARFLPGILATGARGMREWMESGAAEAAAGKTAELVSAERQGGANTIAQEATRTPEAAAALSQLEKANQAVASRVDKLVGNILTGSGKALRAAGAKEVAELSTEERMAKVAGLAQNADALQQHLLAQTADLADHAPKSAQALQLNASMAIGFLHSKAPKLPKQMPLSPKYKLDKAQQWKWDRYYKAVSAPTHILKHAAAGTLTPLDVEAVKTVHPALYAKMQQSILEQLSTRKETVPYRQRLMLSLLTGADLDGTMGPESVMANQLTFATPSSKSGQDVAAPRGPKSTQTGLGKVKVAQRAQTPGQAADARMEG